MRRNLIAVVLTALATVSTLLIGAVPANAATCAAGGACAIGDVGPGGGIVFIAPSTSGNTTTQFFEAAPNTWNGSAPDGVGQWCGASTASVAGLGNGIGSGSTNTTTLGAACTSTGALNAAAYISGRTIGGLGGWFLPSRDEMLALYDQRALLLGDFATNRANVDAARYLTSSQSSAFPSNAIGVYMEGSSAPGIAQDVSKQFNFGLRPMRMFTATERSGSESSSSVSVNPSNVLQQIGRSWQDDCSSISLPSFDWSGASGPWTPSWAEWAVPVTGGFVCTRTLYYVGNSRWAVLT